MKITKITPQIAALYLGQKCDIEWLEGNEFPGKGEIWHDTPLYFGALNRIETGEITITPHLRRLDSITEEECKEVFKIYSYGDTFKPMYKGDTCVEWWQGEFMPLKSRKEISIGHPHVWLYLLSIGFDLFGLIDAGLAKEII